MLSHAILHNRTVNYIIGTISVLIGGLLYLTFRSKSLIMFDWFGKIGFTSQISFLRETFGNISLYSWVKFNLPAALWLFSYMFLIHGIWLNSQPSTIYKIFLWGVPTMAISSELLQFFGAIPGTFDYKDIIAYLAGLIMFFLITKSKI